MGDWPTTGAWFSSLVSSETTTTDLSRPYPFYLAAPLQDAPESLGDIRDWIAEWKWDGIRAQLVRRAGAVHLWSRGEELITHRFPEIVAAASHLPDGTVLDGEVLAFRDDRPLPFAALQQRIGRQKQVHQMAREVPVVFMTYDVIELDGRDLRDEPLSARRAALEQLLSSNGVLRISPSIDADSWQAFAELRATSRERNVEGLMLKRRDSRYGVGRKAWRLVEVEDRAAHGRCRAHLRATRQRQAREPVDRLHLRRVAQRGTRADRESVFRVVE